MADFNQNVTEAKDYLHLDQEDMKKLPTMLNVITILTFIGCAYVAIMAVIGYFSASTAYKVYDTIGTNGTTTENKTLNSLLSGAKEMAKKQYDNRFIIFILALVGVALCLYGALQMRRLKKQGYFIYLSGELLPIVSFAIFIGFSNFLGALSIIFAALFAAVFIILYTTQLKELVN